MNVDFDPKKYQSQAEKREAKQKAKVYNSLENMKQSKIIEEKMSTESQDDSISVDIENLQNQLQAFTSNVQKLSEMVKIKKPERDKKVS